MPKLESVRAFILASVLLLGPVRSLAALAPAADVREVRTDSVRALFDPNGAVPVVWEVTADTGATDQGTSGIGLTVFDVEDTPGEPRPFAVALSGSAPGAGFFAESMYEVQRQESADSVTIEFRSAPSSEGVVLTKTYRFPRMGYTCHLTLTWAGNGEIKPEASGREGRASITMGPRVGPPSRTDAGLAGTLYGYVDVVAAMGNDVITYTLEVEEPSLALEPDEEPIAWCGIHSRYFLLALAPVGVESRLENVKADLLVAPGEVPAGPIVSASFDLPLLVSGQPQQQEFLIYAGPKQRDALRQVEAGFDRVLYSSLWEWLRWLCIGLMGVLSALHSVVPSWGLTIVLLAVLVRIAMYPLAQSGLRAQAKVNADNARLRPHLERIKAEFKNDAVRRHEETMKVYKEHGVNPYAAFKGCGWVIVQLPIFVALFNVIGQAYELRGVEFLWIENLAAPDRLFELGFSIPYLGSSFNLLPVLMAGTQVMVSNLSPAPGADARQQRSQHRVMLLMALAFFVLFYNFPAGLILYWTCSNLGHLLQQYMVNRSMRPPTAAPSAA
jgi:YidC/Oxa1 family membrane protein insertase